MRLRATPLLLATFLLSACQDRVLPTETLTPREPEVPGVERVDMALSCVAYVNENKVRCEAPDENLPEGLRANRIIGGQGTYVRLVSSNVSYDATTEIFSADVTVGNLLAQPMGTVNGSTLHGEGVLVFFSTPATVTRGTGVAQIVNADGEGIFTASGQEYFAYPEVIEPGKSSAAKTWQWHIPSTAETFAFTVLVSSPLQHPNGWVEVDLDDFTASIGDTARVRPIARSFRGDRQEAHFSWQSTDSAVASISPDGLITIVGEGTAEIVVGSGLMTHARLSVGTSARFAVDSISVSVLRPGDVATIHGRRLGQGVVSATLGGVPLEFVPISDEKAELHLPGAEAFPCIPLGPSLVRLVSGSDTVSLTHNFTSATLVDLAPGAYTQMNAGQGACIQMADSAAGYVLALTNSALTASSSESFVLSASGVEGNVAPNTTLRLSKSVLPLSNAPRDLHGSLLQANESLLRQAPRLRSANVGIESSTLPQVGDTASLRLPGWPNGNLCLDYRTIQTRVAHVSARTIVYEDVEAPLAGAIDGHIARVMAEFEGRQLDVLRENFGDLFVLQGMGTPATGRLSVLLSHRVNESGTGFVSAGDLLPRSNCGASNGREIVYIAAPTAAGSDITQQTAVRWERNIRGTLIHEAKHVLSFANRIAAGQGTWEDRWLEEASAIVASEIWSRYYMPYEQGTDATWSAVSCELDAGRAECRDKVVGVGLAFLELSRYHANPGERSPLGGVNSTDGSYYGSGWSLLRWAADHSGVGEAQFFRALTQEGRKRGVANLEARTGRSWSDLVGAWALASALDGESGYHSRLEHPSWDIPGILSSGWGVDVSPVDLPSGLFETSSSSLRGGSSVVFEMERAGARAISIEGGNSLVLSVARRP